MHTQENCDNSLECSKRGRNRVICESIIMGLLRGYHFYFISLFFFIHPSPFFRPQMVRTHGTGGGGILPHSPRKSNRKERGDGGLTPTIYTANGIEFVSEDNAFWLCLVRLPTSYCKRKIKKRGKLVGREKYGLLEPELKVLRETFRWCHELWLRTLSLHFGQWRARSPLPAILALVVWCK